MAELIRLKTFTDQRGSLSVIEKEIPFPIRRVFYIYNVDDSVRGGHRHKKTIQAAICVNGSCRIYNNNNQRAEYFELNSPDKCLILQPEDWHQMDQFTKGSVLLVMASELFDSNDYIFEPY
ncbi:MAG TPA: FdtA/QdtA family cupin domain-containing protein [Chitinophagaceae bacterium]|nr:FdtA/QdtA family cupin domain-containing protein [Chitinophagaceae bacterium]